MSRSAAWFVHGAGVLAGVTGLVYGWMRYVAEPVDEWAIVKLSSAGSSNDHAKLTPIEKTKSRRSPGGRASPDACRISTRSLTSRVLARSASTPREGGPAKRNN